LRSWFHQGRWRLFWCLAGIGSLLWFLVRVIPKPSRAAYPCQRAAFPVASGFVCWLLALVSTRWCWAKARVASRQRRWGLAAGLATLAVTATAVVLGRWPMPVTQAAPDLSHAPVGVAQGIHPGRVVWVHAPEATDWSGYNSPTPWWDAAHTDLGVAEEMTGEAIRSLAGEATDAAAWEALFRYFNSRRGKGDVPYQPGEKIAIKINLTACNARGNMAGSDYEKNASTDGGRWRNTIDNSPQMLIALLRQLVYVAHVAPGDISIGDPTGLFANHLWQPIHSEFPDLRCFDNRGTAGRVRTGLSSTRFHWSTPEAAGKRVDYLPTPFAAAEYIINYAILKGHSAGITVCAKNHYGSLLRCPDGYLRDQGNLDYYDMHANLPGFEGGNGLARYRPMVDLMGHRELGGKTLLYLVDGLFGGYYWEGKPYQWKMPPFGDGVNGDWPNSLFASQDPVAIDSVAYDFLLEEWPHVVNPPAQRGAAGDYLHEAALADHPPSGSVYDPEQDGSRLASLGVHEHWNNATEKLYSRNRGLETGIELITRRAGRPAVRLAIAHPPGAAVLSWRASLTAYRLESSLEPGSAASWLPVPETSHYQEGFQAVTNLLEHPARFYRLAR
jgi:hypothetical protein